jgi:hypothetical protein
MRRTVGELQTGTSLGFNGAFEAPGRFGSNGHSNSCTGLLYVLDCARESLAQTEAIVALGSRVLDGPSTHRSERSLYNPLCKGASSKARPRRKDCATKLPSFMPNFPATIKSLGAAMFVGGVITALYRGESRVSDLMLAAGCLMYLAVKFVEWWNRQ